MRISLAYGAPLLALFSFTTAGVPGKRQRCAAVPNFPFEEVPLTDADVGNFSAIRFGDRLSSSSATLNTTTTGGGGYATGPGPACKAYPGSAGWPGPGEWARLNRTLGGSGAALLQPAPAAAACYDGAHRDPDLCRYLLRNASSDSSRFYLNDPLTALTEWPQGDTCWASAETGNRTCTQGGFPAYVVNATSVRQIQIAVNFARNWNLRLVIKNSGHDFVGRSVGFGSLSIWTHWLKDFEFLPEYAAGGYRGMAVRAGTGVESWEVFGHMARYNMTVVVGACHTVAPWGGWMAGGGHSALSSQYGLGVDQVLSINVVTADGRFVTADPYQNTDLFYALRGGGGGTYGVVTSVIAKAYPAVEALSSHVTFAVMANASASARDLASATAAFWRGFDRYQQFGGTAVLDAGGTAYSYVFPLGNGSFSFQADILVPGLPGPALAAFVEPLLDDLRAAGVRNPAARPPGLATQWPTDARGVGETPGNLRFGSRLFPRENFADPARFAATQRAFRGSVEAGYVFHGIHLRPTVAAGGGWPGNSAAISPAFRAADMHADLFDITELRGLSPAAFREAHAGLDAQMQEWRAVAPDSGAYYNEADLEEPDWQRAFFGSQYPRLLEVKRAVDPWGLFYGPATVGSEAWVVVTENGLPTQNGPLCRADSVGARRR